MDDSFRDSPAGGSPQPASAPTQTDAEGSKRSAWKRDATAVPAPELPTRFEHFEILRREDGSAWQLGSGAMGATYKAVDTRLHCLVALKVIRPELLSGSATARARFLREARTAASVHHPNAARVFHLGELSDGQCFYAMELIEGETLDECVRRAGPLPVLLALEIVLQVTRALSAAARVDLIHRDIKPANLMLTSAGVAAFDLPAGIWDPDASDHPPFVKVIDFGLARTIKPAALDQLTVAGDFVGTPAFASPEQLSVENVPVDSRSDIFSLGATLSFLLTGKRPFAGRSFEEIQRLQWRARPAKQLRQAAVPEPVITLLRSMLAPNPAHRPQTPAALAERLVRCRRELLAALSGPGGRLPPKAAHGQPHRADGERHRFPAALAWALVVLCIAGGLGWAVRAGRFLPLLNHPTGSSPPARSVAPERSVAVLPFANLSDDKTNAYFADGVQDEILTDLARVADLKVISRTSVAQYKSSEPRNLREVAAQLGVANVLEGSVQRVGNTVRVTAQLINARTDTHLWAEHYDRPLDNVFAIQSDIAQAIAGQMQARLSPQEKAAMNTPPTSDFEAYDLYLRARALYAGTSDPLRAREKLPQAARVLDEALARDPKFLLAWCLLARIHCEIYSEGFDYTSARLEQARAAMQTALRLQPDAGETHLALAFYHYRGFRDYGQARAELELARRTLPNEAEVSEYSGYIARREGRWEESTRDLERALELDPRNFLTIQQMALTYHDLHRYDDEAAAYERALAIVPGDPNTRINRAIVAFHARADVQPYQTALAALLGEDPGLGSVVDDPDVSLCERTPAAAARTLANCPKEGLDANGILYPHAYWEGVVARWQGDDARARAAFGVARVGVAKIVSAQPELAIAHSLLGQIDAGLGRKEEAIAEGRRACELLPVSKDAADGPEIAANLAQILAWTGEKTAAIEQLAAVERVPNQLSYGLLKLHPQWDDLRGDPRFEAIVARMAPPPASR